MRLGRVAVPDASLGRRSRAGSKREPDSREFHFTEFLSSPLFHSNFPKRSFCGSSSCAPLVSRVRASFEVDGCSVTRYICAEDPFYGILFSSLLQGVSTSLPCPRAATCLSREATTVTKGARLAGAAEVQAAMPVRPLPRPARRARAVSAAIGRCDRNPSTEVHSNRPLQQLPLLRTPRWRLMRATAQHLDRSHRPHQPGSHAHAAVPMKPVRQA